MNVKLNKDGMPSLSSLRAEAEGRKAKIRFHRTGTDGWIKCTWSDYHDCWIEDKRPYWDNGKSERQMLLDALGYG